jgi:germination protein M
VTGAFRHVGLPAALLAVIALGVVGCGDGGNERTSPATTTATTQGTATVEEGTPIRVYFLHEGKVWPVRRDLRESGSPVADALDELFAGPTPAEHRDLRLSTAIPDGTLVSDVTVVDGSTAGGGGAVVDLSGDLGREGLAQVVYTVTQFPGVEWVEIQGTRYTRADVEEQTPAILVESPLAFDRVSSPLRVTGTANTFEATFEYELTDTDGKIVASGFVTATSGSGTRGTFDFITKPYTVPFDGIGSLIVFERSAKDGSRMHLVEIPLEMSK